MKQGIEKLLDEFDEMEYKLLCSNNNSDGDEMFIRKSFIRSAIETAFKEVSTADFSRQTARIFKNEAHQRGYIAALSNYDQAVDKFLGK